VPPQGEWPVDSVGFKRMLRITVTETAQEQRWILQGHLTKSSVAELLSTWQVSRDRLSARTCIVDLNDVTSIDKDGEQVLSMMIQDGAECIATGVYTNHLLKVLKTRAKIVQFPNDPAR
jgi:ABC-type transporter Mla MlaB component